MKKAINDTTRHQSTSKGDLSWISVSGLIPRRYSLLRSVSRLHRPSQCEEMSVLEEDDDDPLKPTKELESQYGSNKQKINEIEGLLLSLVMENNNDETMEM